MADATPAAQGSRRQLRESLAESEATREKEQRLKSAAHEAKRAALDKARHAPRRWRSRGDHRGGGGGALAPERAAFLGVDAQGAAGARRVHAGRGRARRAALRGGARAGVRGARRDRASGGGGRGRPAPGVPAAAARRGDAARHAHRGALRLQYPYDDGSGSELLWAAGKVVAVSDGTNIVKEGAVTAIGQVQGGGGGGGAVGRERGEGGGGQHLAKPLLRTKWNKAVQGAWRMDLGDLLERE